MDDAELLGRLESDKFVVLVEAVAEPGAALEVARRLAAGLREPIPVEQCRVVMTASIGVSLAEPTGDAESLLDDAEAAMRQAKAAGRDTQVMLDRKAGPFSLAELELEEDLRTGIAQGQLRLALQPVLNLRSGRLEGYEALVRWAHPTRGLLAPSEFVTMAEETGLVCPLGAWVLQRAAEVVADYLPRAPHLALGVNISPRQLVGDELEAQLDETLLRTGFPADNLILELTESLVMRPGLEQELHRLRERGVRLAIDDLGTGYSNLAYLKRLPVSVLKIDRSFVTGLVTDERDRAIVTALITLGTSLGMSVVAEGIESPAQLAVLQQLDCPFGQGYLLGRPGPPPAPTAVLSAVGLIGAGSMSDIENK